jgi:hypothetical protein
MPRTLLALTSLAPLLAGCGQASEEAFNKQYNASFMASCVSSAEGGGAPAQLAQSACSCALDGINAKFSRSEKVSLSPAQVTPIVNACLEKVKPTNG